MGHPSVWDWVQQVINYYHLNGKSVLECGSRGDSVRTRCSWNGGSYVSLDMGMDWPPGHVDIIANANTLPFLSDCFDIVVSTEMLEHDSHPWRSINEMARVVRHGGWVILTARGFEYPLHEAPQDMFRFSADSMTVLVKDAGLTPEWVGADPGPSGVFALAKKE